jgi:phospholipase/carboxylesterase
MVQGRAVAAGRLHGLTTEIVGEELARGRHSLRRSIVIVPEDPRSLLMYFHSAGSDGEEGERLLGSHCAREGVVLVCPTAMSDRWDLRIDREAGDIAVVQQMLGEVSQRLPVLQGHLALAGFGDGASYALSVGLANGDLIKAIIGFSPGFARPGEFLGAPSVLLAHGIDDQILPVSCSHRIASVLEARHQPVSLMEYPGGHLVPAWVAGAAIAWLAAL